MANYLMSVIGAALLCTVAVMLVPDGRGGDVKKYVRLVGSLCLICVIIRPAAALGESLGEILRWGEDAVERAEEAGGYNEVFQDYLASVAGDNVVQTVKELLYERFSVSDENCRVETEIYESEGASRISCIRIYLFGEAVLCDPYQMEDYFGELFNCSCRVY